MDREIKGFGKVNGKAVVKDGIFTVLKGSKCAPAAGKFVPETRENANIQNNILMEDIICSSPSTAGWIVGGKSNNGWHEWKDKDSKRIEEFRIKDKED